MAGLLARDLPELGELPAVNATGGFAASEAWAWHRGLIAEGADRYDPRILKRMSAVLEEQGNPGNLVSLRGIIRLFVPIP